ncbi:PAS domain S-box protein [uncultured Methanolobus sp.]|uniref:PAS domain S-box protein n=1 Tax=uncultured Methanolobus sp. TaxID=218300 RepID=UPI002AAA895C|nr:PAS domain S-box protein [uncultured Methanolobus sp.]
MSGGSRKTSGALPRIRQGHIALLGAALTLVLLMFMLWEASTIYEENLLVDQKFQLEKQLIPYGNSLSTLINHNVAHIDSMGAFVRTNPSKEDLDNNFQIFASGIYSGSPEIRMIRLFPVFNEEYVYPEACNGTSGSRTFNDLINEERPYVRDAVQEAIQTGDLIITDPYELRQGGLAVVARKAIYINDSLWGITVISLDFSSLMEVSGINSTEDDIKLSLHDSSGQLLFGSDEVFLEDPLIYHISFPGGGWELAAVPEKGWSSSIEKPLGIFLKAGIVISLLLASLVYVILSKNLSLRKKVTERTASLKESESRYRQLFDNNSDSLFLIDENGEILDANKVAEDLYGYPRDQLLSMTACELSPSGLRETSESRMKNLPDHGMQFHWTHVRRDGTEFPVDINANSIMLDDQKYILASVRDITENKKTENALLESESRYRLLTDTARDFIIVHDLEGKVLYANRIAVEFSGYTEEELLSRNVTQFVAPEEIEIMKKRRVQRLENERDKYLYETVFVDKNGNEIPVEVSSVPMEEEGLRPSILIIARDITERKKTESALIKSEEMFSTVFNTVPDGIMVSSFDGTIINVNDSFLKNKDFKIDMIIGFSIHELEIWSDPEISNQYVSHLKNDGIVRNFEAVVRTKKGDLLSVIISGDIISTDAEKYMLTVFRDITELKNAENELKKSKSLLDEVSEIANIGGWSFDVESGNVTWTPEIFKIYDLDQENETYLDLNSALTYYVPESRSIIEKAVRNSFEKGESYDFELEIISAKGNHKWVRASGRPVFNNGNVEKVIGSMQDITDRKNVEIVLHKQERLLNEVGDIAKIGGWEFDVSTGEGTWTPEIARIHGVDPDDPTNKDIGISFFVSESKEVIQAAIQDAIDNAEPYDLELELISADGVNKWVRTLARPVLKDGKVVKLTGAMQDITERKLDADRLRESEKSLSEAQRVAHVGNWNLDITNNNLCWSDEIYRIFGYSPQEFECTYDLFLTFVHPDDRGLVQDSVNRALYENEAYVIDHRIILPDGSERVVHELGEVIFDEGGQPIRIIGTVQDITERKQIENALHESENRVRRKLNAILEPEGDIGELDLADIIDIESLQKLVDNFYQLTHIGGMAILDLKGNVLVAVGWQDICTKFHRAHPEACKHCIESDIELTYDVEPGTYKSYKCKNNMWDMVTPIVLGGVHIGNLYVGQFFLDDEEIPYETFRLQAKKYGFDEREYLEALDRVPRWSREKVDSLMTYYSLLTNLISSLSYINVKLARTLNERDELFISLRDSEERFRATFEQAAVGMCQASLDGYFIQVNQRFCDITGYASEELVKMNFPAISYSEDLQKELPYVDKLLTGQLNDYSMEKRYVRKDGSIIWVNVTVAIVHSSEGKPLYFIGMVEDIDYRKKVEEEVVNYTERLNLLHDIDKGIISSSSAEQVANKVLKHLRNLMSCSFARVMLINDNVSRASIFAVDSSYESQIKEGQQTKLNKNKRLEQLQAGKVLLFPDLKASVGYTSPMASILVKEGMRSALSAPLTIEGKLIGILNLADFKPGFFTKDHQEIVEEIANQLSIAIHHSRLNDQVRQHADELEGRVAERTSQLEAANKELEAFTYSVSHDLRSPLRAIDGFSRIITEDYGELFDDEGKRLFNVIRTNTQKMDKLITDLLGLSRVGRNEMNLALISMNAMVDSVYSDLMASENKKNIEFNVSDLPDSYADPALTKQIWTNLLSNAIKYSSSQDVGIIEVGAYTEDGMNIYYVKDNGVGFDPKYAHKLFGIFQRLHSEKEFPGTGVGLAIVQRIARRHGGDVWAEGEPDKGATFYFSLPVKSGGDVRGE